METSTVFWDHENCTVPKGYHGYDIVKKINDFLSNKNVQLTNIFAIGNTSGLAAKVKFELEESGVIVQNASNGKESAADISLIVEVMKNIYYHKPPHTIVLISGDRDFLKMINFLTSSKYTVILIHSKNVSEMLRSSVKETLFWLDLLESPKQTSPVDVLNVKMDLTPNSKLSPTLLKTGLPTGLPIQYKEVLKIASLSIAMPKRKDLPADSGLNSICLTAPHVNLLIIKYVPILRMLQKYTSLTHIPLRTLAKHGFTSREDFLEQTLQLKIIEFTIENRVSLTNIGVSLVEICHGISLKSISIQLRYYTVIETKFHLLISTFFTTPHEKHEDIEISDEFIILDLKDKIEKWKNSRIFKQFNSNINVLKLIEFALNSNVITKSNTCLKLGKWRN